MKLRISEVLVFFLLIIVLSGVSPAQKPNKGMLVSTDWLARNMSKVVVIHVAGKRESYDAGHLPNARFLAFGEITAARNGIPTELPPAEHLQQVFTRLGVGNSKKIVLYGDLNGLMAARAFFTLDYLGHGNRIAILDGGTERWSAERRPISTENFEPQAEPFTPKINPKSIIMLETLRDVSWSVVNQDPTGFAIIDARPKEEYTGARPSDGIDRAGHIPGASSVYWQQNNLVSREDQRLKSEKDLRRIYRDAGVADEKTMIVYCRSGTQASHTYFTLRYLGYRVMMYDGSYFEWNKRNDAPITIGDKRF